MKAFIDSDILIWHLRGEGKATKFLKDLRDQQGYELWTGAMQRAEIVFFMRPNEEKGTNLFLSQFRTAPVDQRIIDFAGELYRHWKPSHNLDINDTILAASVLEQGGIVYSLNKKHYPMPDLVCHRPW